MEAGNENGWRLTNSCLVIYGPVITADRTKTIRCEDPPDDQKNRKAQVQSWRKKKRQKTEFLTAVGLWLIIIVITITVIQHHIASLVCMCSPRRRRGFSVWCFVLFISWLSSGESWSFFILSPLKKKWAGKKKRSVYGWTDWYIDRWVQG